MTLSILGQSGSDAPPIPRAGRSRRGKPLGLLRRIHDRWPGDHEERAKTKKKAGPLTFRRVHPTWVNPAIDRRRRPD